MYNNGACSRVIVWVICFWQSLYQVLCFNDNDFRDRRWKATLLKNLLKLKWQPQALPVLLEAVISKHASQQMHTISEILEASSGNSCSVDLFSHGMR